MLEISFIAFVLFLIFIAISESQGDKERIFRLEMENREKERKLRAIEAEREREAEELYFDSFLEDDYQFDRESVELGIIDDIFLNVWFLALRNEEYKTIASIMKDSGESEEDVRRALKLFSHYGLVEERANAFGERVFAARETPLDECSDFPGAEEIYEALSI